ICRQDLVVRVVACGAHAVLHLSLRREQHRRRAERVALEGLVVPFGQHGRAERKDLAVLDLGPHEGLVDYPALLAVDFHEGRNPVGRDLALRVAAKENDDALAGRDAAHRRGDDDDLVGVLAGDQLVRVEQVQPAGLGLEAARHGHIANAEEVDALVLGGVARLVGFTNDEVLVFAVDFCRHGRGSGGCRAAGVHLPYCAKNSSGVILRLPAPLAGAARSGVSARAARGRGASPPNTAARFSYSSFSFRTTRWAACLKDSVGSPSTGSTDSRSTLATRSSHSGSLRTRWSSGRSSRRASRSA